MGLAVRSAAPVSTLSAALRQAVWDINKDQPVSEIMPMDKVMYSHGGGASGQLIGELLGVFAGLALMLAAIGIYGVVAYVVAQRTHELGIRLALGAGKWEIVRLVMSEGARLAAFGLLFGGLGAAAVPRVLSSALMGIPVSSWVIFLISFALIAGVALAACYVPARRAARVDPMAALRYE